MAISLGDIKKKKITVSPIKNTNTNNTTYNVDPPVNNQREQQVYNLGDVYKNKITVTPVSEIKSKVMAPSPEVSMMKNSINSQIAKNIVSGGMQNDIHNRNLEYVGKTSMDKNIDLSGKSVMGKSTSATKEGLEQTKNSLMSEEELKNKQKKLQKELRNYDRKRKLPYWTKELSLQQNLKNLPIALFNNGYKEDKKYDELLKKKTMVDEELENRFVERESQNMDKLDKMMYTINGNTEKSLQGIESTIGKLTGQDVPIAKDSYNMKLSDEARRQSSGAEGVGLDILGSSARMMPQLIVSGGTGSETASLAVGFANYGGDAYNEAKKMGATEEQATKYGLTIGTLEMGLEKLLGGMENVYGKSVMGKTTSKIMSKVVTNPTFRKILTNASGEFTEEYLQEFLEPIVKNIILEENNGADFWNSETLDEGLKRLSSQLFNGQNLYAGTLGAMTSASMGAPSAVSEGINTKNEVNRIKDTIDSKNAEQNVLELMNKGYDVDTSINIVNKALIKNGISQIEKQSIINKINHPNLSNNSVVEQQNIDNDVNNQSQDNVQNNAVTTQNNTQEKYSNINPPMVIKYQETDNQKINTFRYSAVKEGMLNSKKTTEAMNVIEKIIQDKDYNVKFDRTITNLRGKSVDGKININDNGEVEIALNPNSDRTVEFLLTHEVTHAIETKELRGIILDYANKNSEFESALQDLQKTYGTTNVNDEVIADISGQILGNQEFINSLSMQNTEQSRSFISKVYHSIQRLLNKLTTKGRYRNFVEDLESKWREAYRLSTNDTAVNNIKNDSKYMMTGIKGMNNGVNTNNKYLDIKKRYDNAQKLKKSGIYSNEDIRQETGWFQDKEGNWEFEISDHNTDFKINPQPNTQYKMSDLFEATTLYELYPELKDIKVTFKDMKSNGSYFPLTNNININNELITDRKDAKGTLLHEIQHYIQKVENLPEGTSLKFGYENYANSKGEIEAADTKRRMDMSVKERKQIIPESSKKIPVHPERDYILNLAKEKNKKNIVEKIGNKLYNVLGGKSYEVAEEIKEKNVKDNNRSSRNGLKELDNSSFSINENNNQKYSQESSTWQEHLYKNYKPTGTRTYFDEITNKQITPINHNTITNQNKSKLPTAKEYQKNTIEEKIERNDNVIKVQAEEIANQLNNGKPLNTKERRWIETSTESEILKDKIFRDDLDVNKINYEIQSNKKSLKEANEKLDLMGYDKSISYVNNLIEEGKIPTASDVALAQRTLQEAAKKGDTEIAQNLVMDIAILGTELGQATQAFSMINKLTPEGQLKMYSKIVRRAKLMGDKSFQDVEITPEMVEMILNAYDKNGNYDQKDLNDRVEQFKQKVADQLKTSVEEKIDAWRYLSMLGNPKTHIRNIVSNVAMKCTIAYKNTLARTIETFAPINTRTKTWKKSSKEVKQYAKNTAIEMKDVITGETKYGEQASIERKKRIFKLGALESVSNFNSNALEVEDWLFSKSAFINTFQEYLTANGIKTMEDIKNNPDIVEKGKIYSVEQAEIATFRQYSKLASAINKIERNNKAAKYVIKATIPFKKTPINVAKAGVKYSPLGLIKNVTYDVYQVKKGNINASQFIDNLSQGLSGTSLTILGYALAKAGILTGSGGDDKDDKYDSSLGKQSYSIKIGNKYYSLSWLSPTAMPLFVGANMHEQLEEQKDWDMNILSESLTKTLDPLNEMSFVSSLTDALNSYGSNNDKIKGMGESVVQSYIGQFFPTLFSQFANVGDDTKRSTKASSNSSYKFGEQTVRSIMYKIPGLRNKLEPSTDLWGNEIKQNESILMRALESFILPYNAKEYKNSSIDKEIKKVYNNVGNTDVIPGFPQSYVKYDKVQYRMSAKEYTKYKKTYGTSANTMLNMLMNTSNYKNSAGKRKTRMIKKVYDYSREISKEEFLSNRKIDYDKNDFKYNKNNYKKIVDYITSSTQYKDDD